MSPSGSELPPQVDGPPQRTSPLGAALAALGGLAAIGMAILVAAAPAGSPVGDQADTGDGPNGLFLALVLLGAFLRSGYEVLAWWSRTYRVGSRELVVDEGILSRHHRVVPYARLQQVDLHQSFVQQLLGLAELRLETAGDAGSTMVRLRLLELPRARGLQSFLLDRRAHLQDPAPLPAGTEASARSGPEPEQLLLRLGPGELALAALTHGSVTVGVPIALLAGLWVGGFALAGADQTRVATVLTVAMLVGLLGAAVIVTAQLGALLIGRFGFTIAAAGDDLHLRFGLFERRSLTVPRRRVQRITIVDNPLRRVLGAVEIALHTASTGLEGEHATTRFEIPLLARNELDPFLARLMGGPTWSLPSLDPRPPAARRRAVTRRTLALAALAAVPAALTRPVGLILLATALAGIPWGLTAHRRAGLGLTSEVVATAHGVLHHRIDLVPFARIQSCRSSASPLQRASGLATLHLDVAGSASAPRLHDLDGDTARARMRELPRRSAPPPDRAQGSAA